MSDLREEVRERYAAATNVGFLQGYIADIPLPEVSVDVGVSDVVAGNELFA